MAGGAYLGRLCTRDRLLLRLDSLHKSVHISGEIDVDTLSRLGGRPLVAIRVGCIVEHLSGLDRRFAFRLDGRGPLNRKASSSFTNRRKLMYVGRSSVGDGL